MYEMIEAAEVAATLGSAASLHEAREIAMAAMPTESIQVIDNVAYAMWKPDTRYAEDLLPAQRQCWTRVRVVQDYVSLTGYHAKAGAVGYVVFEHHGPTILFEQASASLVRPNHVDQCALDVPWSHLHRIPH